MTKLTGKLTQTQPLVGNIGAVGKPGKDGVSPTVEVVPIDNGNKVSITDVNGIKEFTVMDGQEGPQGPPGPPGETVAYDDTSIRKRIETLENRPDKDTIYDDTDIKRRIVSLEDESIIGRNLLNLQGLNRIEITKDTEYGIYQEIPVKSIVDLSTLKGKTFSFSFVGYRNGEGINTKNPQEKTVDVRGRFGAHLGVQWYNHNIPAAKISQWVFASSDLGDMLYNKTLDGIKRNTFRVPLTYFKNGINGNTIDRFYVLIYITQKPTDDEIWYLQDFRLELTSAIDGMPYNSLICLEGNANPTDYYGGDWVNIGTESKFGKTLKYWQKLDHKP